MPISVLERPKANVETNRPSSVAREIGGVAVGDYEKNARFEEMTDLEERVGYPIDITIPYRLKNGALYAVTDTRDRPFHEQTAEALRRGEAVFTGKRHFQYERLLHEHSESLTMDAFARGELAGNVAIKMSIVPDMVAEGMTDISGYRRDLLRSFTRIYWRDGDMVFCRHFTLDHNHRAGLEQAGGLAGIAIAGRGSEDILSSTSIIDVPTDELELFVDGLAHSMKRVYDEEIRRTTGRVTHAGSDMIDSTDAHELVSAQRDIIDRHMTALTRAGGDETKIEELRKRTAAEIVLRARGSSATYADVTAELSSGDYGRECPTASNGMNQANQEALKDWKKRVDECPLCHKRNVMAEKKGEIITDLDNGCWLNVCTGEKFIPKSASEKDKPIVTKENAASIKKAAEKEAREKLIKKKYGIWAFELTKRSKEDGKLHNFIYHRWTGKLLADSGRVAVK